MLFKRTLFYVELESGDCILIRANDFAEAIEIESSSADLTHRGTRSVREATQEDIARVLDTWEKPSIVH